MFISPFSDTWLKCRLSHDENLKGANLQKTKEDKNK